MASRRPSTVWRMSRLSVAPCLIMSSSFAYGAFLPLPSMALTCALAIALVALLCQPAFRAELPRLEGLWPTAALFGLVLVGAFWSLTPWTPGGPHPVWEMAGLEGVSTMNISATQIEITKLFGLACTFLIGALMGRNGDRGALAIRGLIVVGALWATAGLILFLSGAQPAFHHARLTGGFYSANTAGTVLGVLSLLAASDLLQAWGRVRHDRWSDRLQAVAPIVAASLLFLASLLLTSSRAAIALTGVGLVIVLVARALHDRRSLGAILAVTVGLLVLLAAYFLLGNSLFADRYLDVSGDSQIRTAILEPHWRAFLASPLFGYGLGTFPEINNQITSAENFGFLAQTIVLHNAYVQWLEEAGLVGAVPMFALVAWIVATSAWRAVRRQSSRTVMTGVLTALALIMAHAAVDVSLNVYSCAALFSLLLGFAFSLPQGRGRGRLVPARVKRG